MVRKQGSSKVKSSYKHHKENRERNCMVRNKIIAAMRALENIHLQRFLITVKELKITFAVLLVPERQELLMLTARRLSIVSSQEYTWALSERHSNSIWVFLFLHSSKFGRLREPPVCHWYWFYWTVIPYFHLQWPYDKVPKLSLFHSLWGTSVKSVWGSQGAVTQLKDHRPCLFSPWCLLFSVRVQRQPHDIYYCSW